MQQFTFQQSFHWINIAAYSYLKAKFLGHRYFMKYEKQLFPTIQTLEFFFLISLGSTSRHLPLVVSWTPIYLQTLSVYR